MIKSLRRNHFRVWCGLALLLPAGIIGAWLVIPPPAYNSLFQTAESQALPVLIQTIKKQDYTVSLRSDADHAHLQLEWINSKPLTAPSALIYQLEETGSGNATHNGIIETNDDLIGRVDARGIYRFPLKNTASGAASNAASGTAPKAASGVTPKRFHFIVYDIIHARVIDQINF